MSKADAGQTGSVPHREAGHWDELAWVERDLFRDPDGGIYEPAQSRSGEYREAHVVMSRGCDWGCHFCTEAIIRAPGELRRSAHDVIEELAWLVGQSYVQRIHFVDDNVFPQIAVSSRRETEALTWTTEFLDGVTKMREGGGLDLGWRGIMRFEDFLKYEERVDGWLEKLAGSGCKLLAFGVESGEEVRRWHLKGGAVTNEQIEGIIRRLAEVGILSKGYFIIGGPDEDAATAGRTIDFARDAGFHLAYFALYKQFRAFVEVSRKLDDGRERGSERETHRRKYATFEQLREDFGALILDCRTSTEAENAFGYPYSSRRLEEAHRAMHDLRKAGFAFRGLFKYNDFHSDMDVHEEHAEVWTSGREGRTRGFLRTVRRAYFEFYARDAFVDIYRRLTKAGY